MPKTLRLNQSLGMIETKSGVFELLATANAAYDKKTCTVVVSLNSFLQLQKAQRPNVRLFADSFVGRRTVIEEVAEEKYANAVSLIFANWVASLERTRPQQF